MAVPTWHSRCAFTSRSLVLFCSLTDVREHARSLHLRRYGMPFRTVGAASRYKSFSISPSWSVQDTNPFLLVCFMMDGDTIAAVQADQSGIFEHEEQEDDRTPPNREGGSVEGSNDQGRHDSENVQVRAILCLFAVFKSSTSSKRSPKSLFVFSRASPLFVLLWGSCFALQLCRAAAFVLCSTLTTLSHLGW